MTVLNLLLIKSQLRSLAAWGPKETNNIEELLDEFDAAVRAEAVADERRRIEQLRGDLNHLLQPIIGMARYRVAKPDSPELNLQYVADRLYLALDCADWLAGLPSQNGITDASYRGSGMVSPRAAGSVPVVQQEGNE